MTFVTASLAIAGACAMVIPIIIHLLFRRRRRPIEWAAMRFLLEAFRRQKKRLRLEQFLLLATRCLIVALLGAALARPMLERAGLLPIAGGQRDVLLVIDNGLVSATRDEAGRTALERHAEQAAAVVRSLGAGDRVALITAAQPARPLVVPPSSDHAAIIDLLESMQPSQSASDLFAALASAAAAIDSLETDRCSAIVYLFTEFRRGSAALEVPLPEGLLDRGACASLRALAPAQSAAPNVQVTSLQPLRSLIVTGAEGSGTHVAARLSRHGGALDRAVTTARLSGEGLIAAEPRVIEWQPGQATAEADFLAAFAPTSSGDREIGLTASIDEDALPIDDARHLVVALRGAVRVVLADRRSFGSEQSLERLPPGRWLARALAPSESSPMQVVEVDPSVLEAGDLRDADAAILPRPDLLSERSWSALRAFVHGGGLILIMPPNEINVHQWTDQLTAAMGLPWRLSLETEASSEGFAIAAEQPSSPLMRLIQGDLPDLLRPVVVQRRVGVDRRETRADVVLRFADGSPLIMASTPSRHGESEEPPDDASRESGDAAAGMVIYLAAAMDLDWTNLPSQPLMVPLMHELIRQGASLVRGAQEIHVGDRPRLGAGPSAAWIEVEGSDRAIVDQQGRPASALERAGLHLVTDSSGLPLQLMAVNIRPEAANTDIQAPAAVSAWLRHSGPWEFVDPASSGVAAGAAPTGLAISGILLLIVLGLTILETLLARWFSHARQGATQPSLIGALLAGSSSPPSTAKGL
jgi:hypothetical protein